MRVEKTNRYRKFRSRFDSSRRNGATVAARHTKMLTIFTSIASKVVVLYLLVESAVRDEQSENVAVSVDSYEENDLGQPLLRLTLYDFSPVIMQQS